MTTADDAARVSTSDDRELDVAPRVAGLGQPRVAYAKAPDGARLFYERFVPTGKRKPLPVVLISGWAANGRLWLSAVERGIEAGYELITVDSRGTGRSSLPPTGPPWPFSSLPSSTMPGSVVCTWQPHRSAEWSRKSWRSGTRRASERSSWPRRQAGCRASASSGPPGSRD